MNHVVRGAAFAVVSDANSTDKDQPPGTAVAPKGSDSPVADWSKPTPYEQIIKQVRHIKNTRNLKHRMQP